MSDVGFLENPPYSPVLRRLTRCYPSVAARIECDPRFPAILAALWRPLGQPFLPHYDKAGKTYVTIAISRAGGEHRLVFAAERFAAQLRGAEFRAEATHLDLPFPGPSGSVPAGAPAAGD
jgi:UPF0042 nucleotide-binding protein